MGLDGDIGALDAAVGRVLEVNWEFVKAHTHSNVLLFREHLRRRALWSLALGDVGYWGTRPIVFHFDWITGDIALALCPHQRVEEATIREVLDYVEAAMPPGACHLTNLDLRAVERFLHWSVVKDLPCVREFNLPDPYESLMRMHERGGGHYMEHGFVHINPYCGILYFPIGIPSHWANISPLTALDDATLEAAEEEHRKQWRLAKKQQKRLGG